MGRERGRGSAQVRGHRVGHCRSGRVGLLPAAKVTQHRTAKHGWLLTDAGATLPSAFSCRDWAEVPVTAEDRAGGAGQVWHSRLGPPAWHPRFGPLPAAAQRAGLACGPDRTLGNVTTAKFYRPCLIYISWMAVFQVVGSADGAFPQHCTPYCAAVKLAGRLKAAGASAPLAAEAAWTGMPPTARSTASC